MPYILISASTDDLVTARKMGADACEMPRSVSGFKARVPISGKPQTIVYVETGMGFTKYGAKRSNVVTPGKERVVETASSGERKRSLAHMSNSSSLGLLKLFGREGGR
jgi:hypothetical protein